MFWVLIRWKWVIFFQSWIHYGTWDYFDFRRPHLILNFSQLKLGIFSIFLRKAFLTGIRWGVGLSRVHALALNLHRTTSVPPHNFDVLYGQKKMLLQWTPAPSLVIGYSKVLTLTFNTFFYGLPIVDNTFRKTQ